MVGGAEAGLSCVVAVLAARAVDGSPLSTLVAATLATLCAGAGLFLDATQLSLVGVLETSLSVGVVWAVAVWLLLGWKASVGQLPYAQLYAEIVDSSRSPLVVLNSELRVMSLNRTYVEMFRPNLRRDELLGLALSELDGGRWAQEPLLSMVKALFVGHEDGRLAFDWEVEQELPRLGLRTLNINARRVSQLDEGVCVLVTVEDVTERKASLRELKRSHSNLRRTTAKLEATQERLAQAERLEAIGRLAGGVAHDFNNMLSAILGFSDLAAHKLPPDHPVQSFLKTIREAGEQSAVLTRQLLAFGRKSILTPKVLDLNAVLASASALLGRLIGEDIDLEIYPGVGIGPVFVDPVQTEQAIVNLAINARDAMPTGGKLRIATAGVHLSQAGAEAIEAELKPGDYVLISVSDTGTGMSADTLSHIFEPFFTTKDPAKGTGLGLASVHGFVKQSGGAICAESRLGGGSLFKLYLPRVSLPAGAPAPVAEPMRQPGAGNETILVVEDEAVVRGVMLEALGSQGYTVLLAANAREGLAICEDYAGTIDLILTDVVMPGMGGKEFIANLPTKRKGARVLYTSGYTDSRIMSHGVDGEQVMFLPKPIDIADLRSMVREVLDATLTPAS